MSATVSSDRDGYRINYTLPGKPRTCLRGRNLGLRTKKQYQAVAFHLDLLISAKATASAIPEQTQVWLSDISDKLHSRIANLGLVQHRCANRGLIAFIDEYIATESVRVASGTIKVWRRARNLAASFFGPDTALTEIDAGRAIAFSNHLRTCVGRSSGSRMSEANACKMCGVLGQVMDRAVALGLVSSNHFRNPAIKRSVSANPTKHFYLDVPTAQKIIACAQDPEQALMFVLGRFMGLRLPSEAEDLRWEDVDLENGVIKVRSPKLRGHHNQIRHVPILPIAENALRCAKTSATSEYVLPNLRLHKNLATLVSRMARRAGVPTWPSPMVNLRASCETDWMNEYNLELATQWCGNSPRVAMAHYHRLRRVANASEIALAARARSCESSGAATGAAPVTLDLTPPVVALPRHLSSPAAQPPRWSEITESREDCGELVACGGGNPDHPANGPYWTIAQREITEDFRTNGDADAKPVQKASRLESLSLHLLAEVLVRALLTSPEANKALAASLASLGIDVALAQCLQTSDLTTTGQNQKD